MKKKMIIGLLIAAAVVVAAIVISSNSFTCDICGEEKFGYKAIYNPGGNERVVCEDCDPFHR